jgi:GTP-binding protein Era
MAFKSGMVAMVGKPNVGKSTLLNALVGHKISIVSNKPQTTRRKVLGVVQGEGYQVVFIDTPGIHEPHTTLGRAMVDAARQALDGVDIIMYVADCSKKPDETDRRIAKLVLRDSSLPAQPGEAAEKGPEAVQIPILLCLNKMDLLPAEMVTSTVEAYTKLFETEEYMLTTATKKHNLDRLMEAILAKMPDGEPLFPEDEFTDQPLRFMVSEIIREKVLQQTKQEVPHATAVVVDEWEEEDGLVRIRATIVVEKQGQKAILIGKHGQFVRQIGTEARLEVEQLIERRVFLDLFVKVKEDWRMNPRMLQELEYTE